MPQKYCYKGIIIKAKKKKACMSHNQQQECLEIFFKNLKIKRMFNSK